MHGREAHDVARARVGTPPGTIWHRDTLRRRRHGRGGIVRGHEIMTMHKGGDWIIGDTPPAEMFTPERLSDDHRLIRQTAQEFVTNEVFPALEELEKKNWTVARTLLTRAGDLGLIGTDVPDAFGGVGLDKAASIVVGEEVGACAAFATTFGAQTGLAIIPILCFGR